MVGKMVLALFRWTDGFVRLAPDAPAEDRFRGRFVLLATMAYGLIAVHTTSLITIMFQRNPVEIGPAWAATGLIFLIPLYLRLTGSSKLGAAALIALCAIHILALATVSGGLASPITLYLVILPVMAGFWIGARAAFGACAGVVAFGLLLAFAWPMREIAPEHEVLLTGMRVFVLLGVVVSLSVLTHAVISGHGIVSRELAEARLAAETAARAKADFLAVMSHEIRTPLNSLIGMVGLLMDTDLDHGQREYALQARTSGEHLLRLVNDILDLSKLEAGKMEIDQEVFRPRAEISSIARLLTPSAEERGVELSVAAVPETTWAYRGDPARLRQVLFNLIGNAVKFTEDGSVTVTARLDLAAPTLKAPVLDRYTADERERVRWLTIEVRDSGIGISPVRLASLFQDFTQGDAKTTRRYGGTGLGLSISRRLVDLMGGIIGAESIEGIGSTFWISIPLVLESAREASPDMVEAPGLAGRRAPGARRRLPSLDILVAEDNEANQTVIRLLLEKFGHNVVVVGHGQEALLALATRRFDLVFLDVEMPVMDGREAARRIRALQSDIAEVPIVALTAHGATEARQALEGIRIDDILTKPIDPKALMALLLKWAVPRSRSAPPPAASGSAG